MQTLIIEPPHPLQRCQLDLFNGPPGAPFLNQFSLEQCELGLSESIDAPMSVNW